MSGGYVKRTPQGGISYDLYPSTPCRHCGRSYDEHYGTGMACNSFSLGFFTATTVTRPVPPVDPRQLVPPSVFGRKR